MRILVIEDEKKIAEFIKRGLKEEGYAVDVARDGNDGYYMVSTNPYDVLILDVMLPGMNGLELCKKIRSDGATVPILMLTAKSSVKDKVEGLDSGANDYLTKPFAFEELLARVRALLRSDRATQTKLTCEDLELDVLTHVVRRGGEDIVLTAKEYALLEYLLRNVNKVVTRTMIMEHVWDVHFDTDSNVIDVYINYLRKKIDADHDKKLIHTLRGRGYVLKG